LGPPFTGFAEPIPSLLVVRIIKHSNVAISDEIACTGTDGSACYSVNVWHDECNEPDCDKRGILILWRMIVYWCYTVRPAVCI